MLSGTPKTMAEQADLKVKPQKTAILEAELDMTSRFGWTMDLYASDKGNPTSDPPNILI